MKSILSFLVLFSYLASAVTTDELVQIHQLSSTERQALSTPISDGTLVFDTGVKKLYVYANTTWKEVVFTPSILEKTADYTLALNDNANILAFNSATAMTLTIPAGLPVGYNISVYQTGLGKVTIVGAAGVTVLNRLSRFKTAGKDAGIGIVATATDTYRITGDLRR